MPFLIANNGPDISYTDYYDSENGQRQSFLSWNANSARLLLSDAQVGIIEEIGDGVLYVVIGYGTRDGEPCTQIMWEDGGAEPLFFILHREDSDREILDSYTARPVEFQLYSRAGLYKRWPAVFLRDIGSLPNVEGWGGPQPVSVRSWMDAGETIPQVESKFRKD